MLRENGERKKGKKKKKEEEGELERSGVWRKWEVTKEERSKKIKV